MLLLVAAVGYYGGQIHGMIDRRPQAPIALHFGELDHGIPLEHVEAIAAAHPEVPVYVYPGAEHGFGCDARDSYDARSTAIALGRTLDFLADHCRVFQLANALRRQGIAALAQGDARPPRAVTGAAAPPPADLH